jgi:hypothetical protein
MRPVFLMVLLAVSPLVASAATPDPQLQFIRAIDRMMVELAPQSSRASQSIKRAYRAHLSFLVLDEYDSLADALNTGGLVPLPDDPRLNVKPRVDGMFPIGEKDLDNQKSYISARPATIGALLDVASRVKSGPVEVTGLVRHSEYQGALRKTNGNAVTSIPMHTMGLAFDIALVNTPLSRIYEIRDVLERMQADGDILFIGERQQLVFHVVPSPSRLGYFTDIYARALMAPMNPDVPLAATPVRDVLRPYATAVVISEVIDVGPTEAFAEEWWAAGGIKSDLTVQVPAQMQTLTPSLAADDRSFVSRFAARCFAVVAGLVNSARNLIA